VVSVHLNKGGGSREVDVPLHADMPQITDIAKDRFFLMKRPFLGPWQICNWD